MSDSFAKKYALKAKEDSLIKSTVSYIFTLSEAYDKPFSNDSFLRVAKGVSSEMVKMVAEMEREGNGK